jgi:hypothetical protein
VTDDAGGVVPIDDPRFPARIDPGMMPGGVVVRIHRWRDGALLRTRRLRDLAGLEAAAEIDADDTFHTGAVIPGRAGRAIVIVGYDGDDGLAMTPTLLITDDPDLIAELGGGS